MIPATFASAQIDTSKSNLAFTGYVEAYYGYDFNEPADHSRPSFIYSHNRHNEFNLNLGFIKAGYTTYVNIGLNKGPVIFDRIRNPITMEDISILDSSNRALIDVSFIKNYFCINVGDKFIFRGGRSLGIGKITNI